MPIHKPATPQEKKIDQAGKDTFPASDPASSGSTTSNEAPARPPEREAPRIRKEDIDAARRGDGHKQK